MRPVYIIIFTVIFFTSCSSSKKFASKKSKEDFFKWIVKQQPEDENKIFYRTIDLSWGNFWIFRDWNILTKKDSSDIQRQIVLSNGALFPDNMSVKRVIVTNEKEDFYLKFSNPIFFDNNKKVWIHYQLWSNGKLGFESFQVYERNRGKYKILQDGSVLNSGDVE